ncbi:MAG: hypothetical protein ACE5GM_09695 [bacterium]
MIDISNGGLSFKSELDDNLFLPGTFFDNIEVYSSNDNLLMASGEVKHITCATEELTGTFYKVGVELDVDFEDAELRDNDGLKKQREIIINPAQILTNLKSVISNKIPVTIKNIEYPNPPFTNGYLTNLTQSHSFYTLSFQPVNQNLNGRQYDEFDRIKATYQFDADGYQFTSVIITRVPDGFELKIPKSITRLWQRITLRHISSDNDPLKVKITHPLRAGQQLEYRVIDLTPSGLSFAINYPYDLFIKNMVIPQVSLVIPGEETITSVSQVKYINMVLDERMRNYLKCGIRFVDLSENEGDFLVSYLLNKTYPSLKDAREENLESIWDLFYQSGFIYKEKQKFLADIATEVNDTFKKLLDLDNKLYKKLILKEGETCYGTVSGVLAYEHTWIIQHLAAVRYNNKCISKDFVLASADFCSKHPDTDYQVMYWRPDNSWADKIFGKFARLAADKSDLSNLKLYHYLFKSPLDNCRKEELPEGVTIEPLTEDDYPLIESYFIARGEFVELQANDLLRDTIDLPNLREKYKKKGLRRERQIYIAKSGQIFLGFVLIEDSSLGINLSGLLNCFKVFTTAECKEIEVEIKKALIQEATLYYRQRGRHFAICLATDEGLEAYESAGFKKKKEYMCWTFSQKLAQPYYNHVNQFFARVEKIMTRKSSNP